MNQRYSPAELSIAGMLHIRPQDARAVLADARSNGLVDYKSSHQHQLVAAKTQWHTMPLEIQATLRNQETLRNKGTIRNNRKSREGHISFSTMAMYHRQQQEHQYLALDCEMVGVGPGGKRSALARVTIVNWNLQIVFDTFVKPDEPVTDDRYFVTGITAAQLQTDGIDFATCRRFVANLLQGKILVGHGLQNDLTALRLSHPWHLIRDTATYEPFMKFRHHHHSYDAHAASQILWPRKLKELAHEHLQKDIQRYGAAHCPIEDAVAALQLYKLVHVQWESNLDYQVRKMAMLQLQQQQQHQLQQQHQQQVLQQQQAILTQ